jgi:hypothetical protein
MTAIAARMIPSTYTWQNLSNSPLWFTNGCAADRKAAERSILLVQQRIASLIPASAYANAQAISATSAMLQRDGSLL